MNHEVAYDNADWWLCIASWFFVFVLVTLRFQNWPPLAALAHHSMQQDPWMQSEANKNWKDTDHQSPSHRISSCNICIPTVVLYSHSNRITYPVAATTMHNMFTYAGHGHSLHAFHQVHLKVPKLTILHLFSAMLHESSTATMIW